MIKLPPEPKAGKARGNRSAAQVPPPIPPKQSAPAATSSAAPVTADRLKSFVERVEKLEEERKTTGSAIRDVYSEAKGVGYDVKTVRFIVQERRLDAADRAERDELRDAYRHALGMAVDAVRGGMSYTEAAEEFGFSRSAIHRASHKQRDGVSGTVEMTAGDLGEWLPAHDAETGELPREMVVDDLGQYVPPRVKAPKVEQDFAASVRDIVAKVGLGASSTTSPNAKERCAVPDTRTPAEVAGDIPAFLDQRPAPLTSN